MFYVFGVSKPSNCFAIFFTEDDHNAVGNESLETTGKEILIRNLYKSLNHSLNENLILKFIFNKLRLSLNLNWLLLNLELRFAKGVSMGE